MQSVSHNQPVWYNMFSYTSILAYHFLLFTCTSSTISTNTTHTSPSDKPNILFILADDIGWADFGFRTPELKTPVLDQLAKDGLQLENYYVQPLCTPTRGSLLTGKYPIHLGLQNLVLTAAENRSLPLQELTMAQMLKRSGYSTHLIGKWHLGHHCWEATPTFRGFDSFYGFYLGISDYYTHSLADGYDFHWNSICDHSAYGLHATDLFAQRAVDIVDEHNNTDPLFMMYSLQTPHAPSQPQTKFLEMYTEVYEDDPLRARYAALVTSMDTAIGRVFDAFKRKDIWNNTLVIFSSDNGGPIPGDYVHMDIGASNYPLRGGKFSLAEGGVKATGIMYGPTLGVPQGKKYNGLMHVADWLPTLATTVAASIEGINGKLDGIDQYKALFQDLSLTPRREALLNINPHNIEGYHAAIRANEWKLLVGMPGIDYWWKPESEKRPEWSLPKGAVAPCTNCTPFREGFKIHKLKDTEHIVQLYNIAKDPTEHFDLTEKHLDIVHKLWTRIQEFTRTALEIPNVEIVEDDRALPVNHDNEWKPWNPPSNDKVKQQLAQDKKMYAIWLAKQRKAGKLPPPPSKPIPVVATLAPKMPTWLVSRESDVAPDGSYRVTQVRLNVGGGHLWIMGGGGLFVCMIFLVFSLAVRQARKKPVKPSGRLAIMGRRRRDGF
eukprot:TRINITY_DN55428_c0_g1_i1.p1 TRINITY_DN55428_c0_g1~~TRINITY_DN55428_c0_g1_i1.p1  ORF type:complete len:663 (-),score=76.31 TRINITY_DN55428_c0_g1_i1:895-2883(-)